jgi:hypothetical protein
MPVSIPVEQIAKAAFTMAALHRVAPFTKEHEVGAYPDLCDGCRQYKVLFDFVIEDAKDNGQLEAARAVVAAVPEGATVAIVHEVIQNGIVVRKTVHETPLGPAADPEIPNTAAPRTFKLCDRVRLGEHLGEVRQVYPDGTYKIRWDEGFDGLYPAYELELEDSPAEHDGEGADDSDGADRDEDEEESPAPASTADTRDPRTWSWPTPNEHGVYLKYVPDHVLEYKEGKVHLRVELLQVRNGMWAEAYQHDGSDWHAGGGMQLTRRGPTTLEGAARRQIEHLREVILDHKLSRKAQAWLSEAAHKFGITVEFQDKETPAETIHRMHGGSTASSATSKSGSAHSDRRDPFGQAVTVDERRRVMRYWNLDKCELALEPGVVNGLQTSIKAALIDQVRKFKNARAGK